MSNEKLPVRPGQETPDVPDGEHAATIIDVGYLEAFEDGSIPKGGPQIEWHFQLDGTDGPEGVLRALSSAVWNAGSRPSKLAKWCRTLGIDASEGLEPADVIGKACRVYVTADENGWPRVRDLLAPKQ